MRPNQCGSACRTEAVPNAEAAYDQRSDNGTPRRVVLARDNPPCDKSKVALCAYATGLPYV